MVEASAPRIPDTGIDSGDQFVSVAVCGGGVSSPNRFFLFSFVFS